MLAQEPGEGLSVKTGPTLRVSDPIPLSDLALATFCPRKLFYARQHDRSPPPEHDAALELAFAYPDLLAEGPPAVADRDLGIAPEALLDRLRATRDRLDAWTSLVDPAARDATLVGKDVVGRVAKVLEEPLAPSLVSPGEPPPEGVWEPQSVRAVGAAKALAWEREATVEQAFVEYPRHGVVRRVEPTTRRAATYRRTLRTVRSMEGPPPRLGNDAKCGSCRFASECGVKTRSLRSLL
jgi:CRISPR-associated exonuclease Cas4